MGNVAIQASFGKDSKLYNGLEAIADDLIDKPQQERYVICKVRTRRTTTDHENGGAETATIKFVHIEPMLTEKSEQGARKLFEAAAKARLGELPQQTLFEDKADEDDDDGPWPGDKPRQDGGDQGTLSDEAYALSKVRPDVGNVDFIAAPGEQEETDTATTDTAPAKKAPRKRALKAVDSE